MYWSFYLTYNNRTVKWVVVPPHQSLLKHPPLIAQWPTSQPLKSIQSKIQLLLLNLTIHPNPQPIPHQIPNSSLKIFKSAIIEHQVLMVYISNNIGYPDVNFYGNANNNYLNAPARQTQDIIPDEDIGYYAANGRNVSVRVDMNRWLLYKILLELTEEVCFVLNFLQIYVAISLILKISNYNNTWVISFPMQSATSRLNNIIMFGATVLLTMAIINHIHGRYFIYNPQP